MNKDDMIFQLLTKMDESQDSMKETMIRIEADLAYHIKRTDLLEDHIDLKIREVENSIDEVVEGQKPNWKLISLKFTILATIIGIISTIYKYFQ